jgi:hypothetical protein
LIPFAVGFKVSIGDHDPNAKQLSNWDVLAKLSGPEAFTVINLQFLLFLSSGCPAHLGIDIPTRSRKKLFSFSD